MGTTNVTKPPAPPIEKLGTTYDPYTEAERQVRTGNNDFAISEQLRQQALAQADEVAASAKAAAVGLESAYTEGIGVGEDALLDQAARALAAQQGATGGSQSGANLAAAGQVARDRGMAQAQFASGARAEAANVVGQANTDAALAALEATKFRRETGTLSEQRLAKDNYYRPLVDSIVSKYKGDTQDDEDAMYYEIMALVEGEPDPVVQAKYRKLADDIRTKRLDV
jgi:hypothetical protein